MNLNDLFIFKGVLESGSFNKATQILGYAQSNISQRIKGIENEIGTKLFIRNTRGIKPTNEGEIFYRYCIEILEQTEQMKIEIKKERKSNLLCSELIYSHLLMKEEIQSYNEVDIVSTGNIISKANKKNYDKVLAFNNEISKYYKMKSKHNIELSYYIGYKSKTELPLLVNKDKLCPLRTKMLSDMNEFRIFEVDSLDNIIRIVESGNGISLLPTSFEYDRKIIPLNEKRIILDYYEFEID